MSRTGGQSLSARRAWIEIAVMRQNPGKHYVALRKESVDRNQQLIDTSKDAIKVALRKESVDRNLKLLAMLIPVHVALRKESVDRNGHHCNDWSDFRVALRKESVDRNHL